MKAGDQFHTGIVVDDLDTALDQMTSLFGYEWGQEVDVDQVVRLPGGTESDEAELTVRFRFRYSIDTPRLELIQARPGTIWTPAEGSGVHHLGFWSEDLARDSAELEAAGHPCEVRSEAFAYHRNPRGPRIELVDRTLEPLMSALWEPAPAT